MNLPVCDSGRWIERLIGKKVTCLALGALLLAASYPSESQQLRDMPRIGWLSPSSPSLEPTPSRLRSFHQGLADLGYVEGKNIAIEYRYAEGKLDRLPDLAAELVRLKVNILVTTGNESTHAAKNATRTIPIVMGLTSDPVELGFVESLARPGGNVTGISNLASELGGKRVEVLKEIVPSVSSVFALWHQASPGVSPARKEMESAARALGMKLQFTELTDTSDFDRVFSSIGKGPTKGLVVVPGAFIRNNMRKIVAMAVKNQLPGVYLDTRFVDAGGLVSYGTVRVDEFRRAATFVDKILKGVKPGDLPVEQPTRFELVINLKAAKQIGLTIPPNVLARADKVIK
jgi:putative ABC transport system substrate-binding protein